MADNKESTATACAKVIEMMQAATALRQPAQVTPGQPALRQAAEPHNQAVDLEDKAPEHSGLSFGS